MNGMLNLRFSVLLGTLVVSGLAGCTRLDRDSDNEPPELNLSDGFRSEVLYSPMKRIPVRGSRWPQTGKGACSRQTSTERSIT